MHQLGATQVSSANCQFASTTAACPAQGTTSARKTQPGQITPIVRIKPGASRSNLILIIVGLENRAGSHWKVKKCVKGKTCVPHRIFVVSLVISRVNSTRVSGTCLEKCLLTASNFPPAMLTTERKLEEKKYRGIR
ncbi:hypothetical protein RRG08_065845 [Elysia crispata]|uniref:Uncharacterized protein n=1 Tax=Elysia crispata TaxID=231223 RepID=A0AAE1DD69_9GAST|nr:hypothetical protein RRG08_065845 [Elysia crispata]